MKRKARDVLFCRTYGEAWKDNEIVSNDRLMKQGEVYTPYHIVKFMVENVKKRSVETKQGYERYYFGARKWNQKCTQSDIMIWLADRVFDPACGSGGYPEVIFTNKIKDFFRLSKFGLTPSLFEVGIGLLNILMTIQAMDILLGNVKVTRERLFYIAHKVFKRCSGGIPMPLSLARLYCYVLQMTIQCENTLLGEYLHVIFHINSKMEVEVLFWGTTHGGRVFYDGDFKICYADNAKFLLGVFEDKKYNKEAKRIQFLREHGMDYMIGVDLHNPPPNDKAYPMKFDLRELKKVYELHKKVTQEFVKRYKGYINNIENKKGDKR